MSETWLTRYPWCTRQSWRSPTGMSFWPSGRMTASPRVVIGHSTETTGFPGYRGGADAPHFTIHLPSGQVRQHIPLEWGSRCLAVSTGGVTDRTVNVSGTIQIEVIGAVTPGYPARYGHYDLPGRFPTDRAAQGHLARLLRAIHDATRIPLRPAAGVRWVPYPASYGVRASQRLSSAAFRAATGVLGHQHAVANDHGDGLYGRAVNGVPVDLETVLGLAREIGAAPPVDVDAPARSTWEVTTAALNARTGAGTEHAVIGSAVQGEILTATGRSSGPWVQATRGELTAWWHSGFLTRTTTTPAPTPDPAVRRVQQLLADLGYSVGATGVDGFYGPLTEAAITQYATDTAYPGSRTAWAELTTHLEDTMSTLTELATTVARIDRRLHDHMQRTETVTVRRQTAPLLGVEEGRVLTVEQLHDLVIRVALRNGGQVAGLESALESLAEQTGGIDVEAVKAAARTGAEEALAGLDFEVTAVTTTARQEA